MDNRMIHVVGEGDESLTLAMKFIWPNAAGGKATHYKIENLIYKYKEWGVGIAFEKSPDGQQTLILLWAEEDGALQLPFPLDLKRATEFVQGWLQGACKTKEPDHDGSNRDGFRLFTDGWGHVAGYHYGIIGVQHEWAMYGK